TINGLNTIGIGYVDFFANDFLLPLNDEYSIRTTIYEQLLGEQTSIIIRKPLSDFLMDTVWIGVKQGNHVLPFFPVDLPKIQVKNTFDFSPDPALKYDEFGKDTPLEHDVNGNDSIDFYPLISSGAEQSILILAGTTGEIVFTDLPSRGVIEICPSVDSQKSCSSLARNRPDPEGIEILVGNVSIGTINRDSLYMEPGDSVNPGFPIAVIGTQGVDFEALSLKYSHRYRFQAHNALPMIALSEEVINGIDLRDFPEAFVASEFVQRCPYSVFTADLEGDQFLGFPDDVNCQIPFFSWVIYGDEVFVPLPDVAIIRSDQ
ncbi:MAG: hypothetical protein V2J07_11120, partial [Anaerolineae bacterium]|nr:hypothetical protein [Anaerolineae bacterium]